MENKEFKSGFVTLIGRPNVGKSTLMNHLIGQKIAITSNRPQTTRNRIRTIYTEDRGQIIFLDTPGIHKSKNKLGEYMNTAVNQTLSEVDVILWLVEASSFIGNKEKDIAERLKQVKTPVVLIINKIDTVKKEKVLEFIQAYQGLYPFAEIVPVSALKSVNIDSVFDVIFKYLPYGPQYYEEDMVTDQPVREIAAEIIREKALRLLNEEIPHGIAVTVENMKQRENGIMDIEAEIICEKESHKGIVIGKGGEMLKRIGTFARTDIEDMMEQQVNLKIWVKVRKEWRDSDLFLKSYGYDKKNI
ncbi:MAG: GTPase Era [Lachnospiraceae bacterium]